jgi:hypothetical protein
LELAFNLKEHSGKYPSYWSAYMNLVEKRTGPYMQTVYHRRARHDKQCFYVASKLFNVLPREMRCLQKWTQVKPKLLKVCPVLIDALCNR